MKEPSKVRFLIDWLSIILVKWLKTNKYNIILIIISKSKKTYRLIK